MAEVEAADLRRNAERTKGRILAAASVVFSQRGVDGATMEQIAERSAVNKRMVYHYFGDKEALYLAVLEATYAARRQHDAILDLRKSDPEEGLRRLIRQSFAYCRDNPDYVKLLIVENLNNAKYLRRSERILSMHMPLVDALDDVLQRGSALGLFRSHVEPVQLYLTIASLCFFYFSNNATISTIFGRDFRADQALAEREAHIESVILGYLRPRSPEEKTRSTRSDATVGKKAKHP